MHNRALARGLVHNGIILNSFPVHLNYKKFFNFRQKCDKNGQFRETFKIFLTIRFFELLFFSYQNSLFFQVCSFLVYFGTFSLFFLIFASYTISRIFEADSWRGRRGTKRGGWSKISIARSVGARIKRSSRFLSVGDSLLYGDRPLLDHQSPRGVIEST